jgi:hypothetical protein
MQDMSDSVRLEAAMNSSENLVNYWLFRKVINIVSYAESFIPVYKSGVYGVFMAMNFDDFLKAWPSLYQYKFNKCRNCYVTQTKECLITIRAIEWRG